MIELFQDVVATQDLNAQVNGFIVKKTIRLYEKKDTIPTYEKWVEPPLIMVEVLDDEVRTEIFDSTDGREIILMKPLDAISLSDKQTEFFKKYWKEDGDSSQD